MSGTQQDAVQNICTALLETLFSDLKNAIYDDSDRNLLEQILLLAYHHDLPDVVEWAGDVYDEFMNLPR